MRYWMPLAVVALCSCEVTFTYSNTVEVVGTQSQSEKLILAKSITNSLLKGELAQDLKNSIPDLNDRIIAESLKVGWRRSSDKNEVHVKCTFKSSLPKNIAKQAVDICTSHASASLDRLAADSGDQSTKPQVAVVQVKQVAGNGVSEAANLSIPEFIALRDLLNARNYEQLNKLLSGFQSEYEADTENEFRLTDAYRAFQLSDESYENVFVDWMNQTPDSYQPYLAAAHYHFQRGWSARGSTLMVDVSKDGKTRFYEELQHAARLVQSAVNIKLDLMPAHRMLLNIQRSTLGYQEDAPLTESAQRALALFPDSLEIRIVELNKRQPRWGGSFELMHEFVENEVALHPKTEKFRLLRGLIDIEKSRHLYSNKQYKDAFAIATGATAQGKLAYYYYRRSKFANAVNRLDTSLDDINTAIALRPSDYENHLQKGHVLAKLNRVDEAIETYALARQLNRATDDVFANNMRYGAKLLTRRAANVFKTDLDQAVALYDKALKIDKNYHEAVYWRANALFQLGRYDEAEEGYKRSMAIDPTHFESHRNYDYVLVRDRRWDDIIAVWDSFIARHPEHAGAYLERSGTHYHNGNQQQSKADLRKACELESSQACQMVASFEAQ